ncbi:hypothetical protein D3C76_841930 [compost metagenome]
MRVQRRHQHQPPFQVRRHLLGIRLDARHAVLLEVAAAVSQQFDRLQQVVDDHRLEHVQLQMPLAGGKADRRVIAQHLAGQHRQCFALGRVDLAWHDRAARLVGRQAYLGQPGARAGTQQAQVVGDFHQGHGQGLQGAGQAGQRLVAGEGSELVRRSDERQAGQRRQLAGDGFGKTMRGVESGTHGSAALGQFTHRRQGGADGALGIVELGDEGRHLLAEGDRRGVHHVRAAGLHQLLVACRQLGQPRGQLCDGRQQLVVHRVCRSDVHGGGEAVVGTLRAVDVVVGVHGRLAATALAGQFVGPPGDHFVDVHVALGAAAGLPDHQRELIVMLAVEHFVGGLLDQPGDFGRQVTVAIVDPCCSLLDQRQGVQHREGHAFLANGEVDQRTLGLRTPVGVLRNFDRAQAVCLDTAHSVLTPV